MKTWMKTLGRAWFTALCMLSMDQLGVPAAAAAPSPANLQINDSLISFPDVQPYIDLQGHMIVPVRPAAEAVGARVSAEEQNGTLVIRLSKGSRSLVLFTGSDQAVKDGLPVKLDAPVTRRDGRVLVPLHSLLEWLGYRKGWDSEERLAIVWADGKPHQPAIASASKKEQILETADNFLGVPYVWGGTKPEGFDCSGFVQYVYRQHGVDLPRTSKEMFAQAGDFVGSEPQPGDLVFFAEGKTTSHVGIYIGDGRFISATTSYGVHIARLRGTYWGPQYIGAKRVL